MRIDKLSLAALEATLRLYREPERARREIPVLAMLERTQTRFTHARGGLPRGSARARPWTRDREGRRRRAAAARARGPAVALGRTRRRRARARAAAGEPPVLSRIHDGRVLLDPRTVQMTSRGTDRSGSHSHQLKNGPTSIRPVENRRGADSFLAQGSNEGGFELLNTSRGLATAGACACAFALALPAGAGARPNTTAGAFARAEVAHYAARAHVHAPAVGVDYADCIAPAGNPAPGTAAWQQHDTINQYCATLRLRDQFDSPAYGNATGSRATDLYLAQLQEQAGDGPGHIHGGLTTLVPDSQAADAFRALDRGRRSGAAATSGSRSRRTTAPSCAPRVRAARHRRPGTAGQAW